MLERGTVPHDLEVGAVRGRIEPVGHSGCHHAAICTRDWDQSLRFWRDGMGLVPQMELKSAGQWAHLFKATGNVLNSIFLHDPRLSDGGIVELVEFEDGIDDGAPLLRPRVGFFLLSFYLDVEKTLARLAALGVGGTPRSIAVDPTGKSPVEMALVEDPNGVWVELIGLPPQ